jgi:hypothetical protein
MTVELVAATAPMPIEPVAAQHTRRLMAVMLADVVGYSRMMSVVRTRRMRAFTAARAGAARAISPARR